MIYDLEERTEKFGENIIDSIIENARKLYSEAKELGMIFSSIITKAKKSV